MLYDVSSVSSSSERIKELWAALGLYLSTNLSISLRWPIYLINSVDKSKIFFSNTVALSTLLEGKSVDLIEAAQEVRVVINIMRAERVDPVSLEGNI